MPKIPGCSTTSGRILQHAFYGYSDPQRHVTCVKVCDANLNKAERAQTWDSFIDG